MGFWKWYYRGILRTPRALISPSGEYAWAVLVFVLLSLFLGTTFSQFYLFLTVPISVTIAVHAYWRAEVRKKTE